MRTTLPDIIANVSDPTLKDWFPRAILMSENETLPEIEADLRSDKRRFSNSDATAIASRIQEARKRQEQAHQKELDALHQQIADLRQQRDLWSKRAAELVEKCNDQYAKMKRDMATTEKKSAVGDCAKLREVAEFVAHIDDNGYTSHDVQCAIEMARAAIAAPPRNCEKFRNADEALEALERHCNSSGNGCIRCPVAGFSTEEVECKIAWLLAPATEKKGDSDGNE